MASTLPRLRTVLWWTVGILLVAVLVQVVISNLSQGPTSTVATSNPPAVANPPTAGAPEVTFSSRIQSLLDHTPDTLDVMTIAITFLVLVAAICTVRSKAFRTFLFGIAILLALMIFFFGTPVLTGAGNLLSGTRNWAAGSSTPFVEVRFTPTSETVLPLTLRPDQKAVAIWQNRMGTRYVLFCPVFDPATVTALRGTGNYGTAQFIQGWDGRVEWTPSAAVRTHFGERPITLRVRLVTSTAPRC